MEGGEEGIVLLFSKLCAGMLEQALSNKSLRTDRLLASFQAPSNRFQGLNRTIALRQLMRTVFDLLLLRKWAWFGSWGTEMSPKCQCLSHTYQLHLRGRHKEAVRLKRAVEAIVGEETPLQEKEAILKFLALMASSPEKETTLGVSQSPDDSGVFCCYESFPSSLFEQLPVVNQVTSLDSAVVGSVELFECIPGSGFRGFFTAESLGKDKAMQPSTLFNGLTHSTTGDLNTPLDLPNLPSHADSVSLLRKEESRESGVVIGAAREPLSPARLEDRAEEESALSLALADERLLPPRAWEGWEDSKQYLLESGAGCSERASGLCLPRLASLAGVELPVEGGWATPTRRLVSVLDTLPPNVTHPLEERDSVSRAFGRALSSLLVYCRAQLHELGDGKSDLQLQAAASPLLPLLTFLIPLLSHPSHCSSGLPLLDSLHSQAMRTQGTPHYPLLLSLLRQSSLPYLEFVHRWVFEGWLDVGEEFGITSHQESLTKRDHCYWTLGYTSPSPCTPQFLTQYSDIILSCGKALNLLRLCCPTHPLCVHVFKPPRVSIAISVEDLEQIGQQCQAYTLQVTECVQKDAEGKKNEELARAGEVQADTVRARQEAREAAERMKNEEQAQLEAEEERKRELFRELKTQMEAARALRTERELEEYRDDQELLEAAVAREHALMAGESQLKEEARAELVAHYEELYHKVEQRRLRAEWQSQRLELSSQRRQFLQRDREAWAREMERGLEMEVTDHRRAEQEERDQTAGGEGGSGTAGGEDESLQKPTSEQVRSRRTWVEREVGGEGVNLGERTWVASLNDPLTSELKFAEGEKDGGEAAGLRLGVGGERSAELNPTEVRDSEREQEVTESPLKEEPIQTASPGEVFAGTSSSTPLVTADTAEGYRPHIKSVPGASVLGSVVQEVLYGHAQSAEEFSRNLSPRLVSTRGHQQPSIAQDLLYGHQLEQSQPQQSDAHARQLVQANAVESVDAGASNLPPVRHHELPSVAQHIIYGHSPMTPVEAEILERHAPTRRLRENQEPPTVAQEIIYALQGGKIPEDSTTPRLKSSRGQAPSSVAQDIIYSRGSPQPEIVEEHMTPKLISTRGHPPPSVAQDLIYSHDPSLVKFHSTRGGPPPTTIQALLYPIKHTPVRHRAPVGRDSSVQVFHPFQPYTDSYPMLDLLPLGAPFDRLLGIGQAPPTTRDPTPLFLFPLPSLLEHSLILPILTQVQLVNSALVSHFLSECQISRHFLALKRFLLLEDGEFGHTLATRLFEELTYGHSWSHLCSASFLNPLLSSALDSSLHGHRPEADRLSFALKYRPRGVRTNTVEALDFLELQYKVDWPCNIVITGDCISKYNKVFQLLLQLKRASWALKNVFAHLKQCEGLGERQLRQLQIHRHELQHFVNVMHGYIAHQLLVLSWREFETDLSSNVHSLDNLIRAHHTFLERAIFRCLLSKKARPVMNIIQAILASVLRFSTQLTTSPADRQRVFRAMGDTHRRFREAAGLLMKVVTKLVQRGYQPHLEDLLLRLNFNNFYM